MIIRRKENKMAFLKFIDKEGANSFMSGTGKQNRINVLENMMNLRAYFIQQNMKRHKGFQYSLMLPLIENV